MGVVRVKDGVQFTKIAPAGFRILAVVTSVADKLTHDLRITSACDGPHSGPNDPHHRGEAYDVGSKELGEEEKPLILQSFQDRLEADHFYCFLESPDTDNEHFHLQIKKGTTYP